MSVLKTSGVLLAVMAQVMMCSGGPAPAPGRPDVLVLIPPGHEEWKALLAGAMPSKIIQTEKADGTADDARFRFEVGTSVGAFKDWRYAFALQPPKHVLASTDIAGLRVKYNRYAYSLYFLEKAGDKPVLVLEGAVHYAAATPVDRQLKILFISGIDQDLAIGLAAKVYGAGTGTPLMGAPLARPQVAYPVAVKGNQAEVALQNRLPVPVDVGLTMGRLVQQYRGDWSFDNMTASPNRSRALQPNEKMIWTVTIPEGNLEGLTPMSAAAGVRIVDPRVASLHAVEAPKPVVAEVRKPLNPPINDLMAGHDWAGVLKMPRGAERREKFEGLVQQWTAQHAKEDKPLTITATFCGFSGSPQQPLTADFQCWNSLADGAAYHAILHVRVAPVAANAEMQRARNQAARKALKEQYQMGVIYTVAGVATRITVEQDGPVSEDGWLLLEFHYEKADVAVAKR